MDVIPRIESNLKKITTIDLVELKIEIAGVLLAGMSKL